MVPFFDFTPTHQALKAEMQAAWEQFYSRQWYILGEEVRHFEAEYATWNHTRHCVGVANGLDALVIALRALGIGPGDEVIVPSNTYIASWLAVSQVGATVVPVEPNPQTWNIDSQRITEAITPRTRAVMPVHLYGQACEMAAISAIAKQHGLAVVEDNAQGHGARCEGRPTGSWGHVNATSFYPTKNLGALGDAGGITTDDDALADFCRTYRNYGSKTKYFNEMAGSNSRLDELQAALLRIKLRHLDAWNAERAALASTYLRLLDGVPGLQLPTLAPGCTSVWHLFVVLSEQRDDLQAFLKEKGIQTMIHYPVAPHLQQAYAGSGFKAGQFPLAEHIARTCLSLPLFPGMTTAQVEEVCEWLFKV